MILGTDFPKKYFLQLAMSKNVPINVQQKKSIYFLLQAPSDRIKSILNTEDPMLTKSLTKLLSLSAVLIFTNSMAHAAGLCGVNSTSPDWCNRMGHLRATINSLDSQRELMQMNFEHLLNLGVSLEQNAQQLQSITPTKVADHAQALDTIKTMGADLTRLSKLSSPEALVVANSVRSQCLNCHNSSNPTREIIWNDVFGYDWFKVSKDCSMEGRNPYLCKSMNAMMTSYNHLLTAYKAGIKNYAVTGSVGKEVVRVLRDLKEKNFNHLGEANRQMAEAKAQEVVDLAKAQNPDVFEKAFDLTSTCMNCHNNLPNDIASNRAVYNVWK